MWRGVKRNVFRIYAICAAVLNPDFTGLVLSFCFADGQVMTSERALLFTRLLLLLHLVRGAFGVPEVTTVVTKKQHIRNFCAVELSVHAWKSLASDVRRRLKKIKKPQTYLAHSEGLCAGYSGFHPIYCLANSAKARAAFDDVVRTWSAIVVRCFCKGFVLSSQHVIVLWEAVRGKAPMALRQGKVHSAGNYTAMSLARSLAPLVPQLFDRAEGDFDATLYNSMKQGQSKIEATAIAIHIFLPLKALR